MMKNRNNQTINQQEGVQTETFRAFLSVNLSAEITGAIQRFQARTGPEISGIRWTNPATCHLTLKFFGDISPERARAIESTLRPVVDEISAFQLEFSGVGQFPPKGPPAVIWFGVTQGKSALLALEQSIHQRLVEADIGFDNKTFIPHLTIGRAVRNQRPNTRALKKHKQHTPGCMTVEGFSLMKSTLTPKGPVYETVAHFPLASP